MFSPSPPTGMTWSKPAVAPSYACIRSSCARPFSTSPRAKPALAVQLQERASEAEEAARILGVAWREALDIPDGRVENTWENRIKIVRKLRQLRPRVVILPYWQGRHPDHYNSAALGYEACFLSGLAKIETGESPFRPFKIVYASLYADVRPSFVVDITPFIEERFRALLAYRSQYADQPSGGTLFVPHDEIRERTFSVARHYGLLGGVRYAEPYRAEGSQFGR